MKALTTPHGTLPLPVYMPDATRGVVRGLDSQDLQNCRIDGIVVNAFHLAHKPGSTVISKLGGIHRFAGWDGPIISDSGGFQVLSLMDEGPAQARATGRGFYYRLQKGQKKRIFSALTSIRRQIQIGADVLICLDHCTHPDSPPEIQRVSVDHTIKWARICRQEFDRNEFPDGKRPLLFAVVQGADSVELRRRCVSELLEIGFDGYGFGGWPIRHDGTMVESVALVASLVPKNLPLMGLGIGKPEHLARAALLGYDLFDCALPTRDARHGRIFALRPNWRDLTSDGDIFYDSIYPLDKKHLRSDRPIDPTCDCLCCTKYTLGYLHHLFRIRDTLAFRLGTIHNLRLYSRFTQHLRSLRSED